MTELFSNSITAAMTTLRDFAGRKVRYRRGDAEVMLVAVPGKTDLESANPYGIVEQHEARDYLIMVDDLIINDQTVQPDAGDQIIEHHARIAADLVYEVMSPGGEMPAWRFSDAGRTRYRIHTKLVEEVPL